MTRVVFIDRDGVINVDPIGDYIKRWEDFTFEPCAITALKQIRDLGLEIIIISNQAGVGDGVYPERNLREIHANMVRELERHGIKIRSAHYCLHGKSEGCKCRKPATGLFEEAVKGLAYDPSKTFFIGDKASDMEAGKRFGLKTIFVLTGHGQLDKPKLKGSLVPDHIAADLAGAVRHLKS